MCITTYVDPDEKEGSIIKFALLSPQKFRKAQGKKCSNKPNYQICKKRKVTKYAHQGSFLMNLETSKKQSYNDAGHVTNQIENAALVERKGHTYTHIDHITQQRNFLKHLINSSSAPNFSPRMDFCSLRLLHFALG